MSFVYQCPHCQEPLEVQEEWVGMEMRCPICSTPSVVPAPDAALSSGDRASTDEPKLKLRLKSQDELGMKVADAVVLEKPSGSYLKGFWKGLKKAICWLVVVGALYFGWRWFIKEKNTYAEQSKTCQIWIAKYPRRRFSSSEERLEAMRKVYPELVQAYRQFQDTCDKVGLNAVSYRDLSEERGLLQSFCGSVFKYAAVAPRNDPIHWVVYGLTVLLDETPPKSEKEKERRYGLDFWKHWRAQKALRKERIDAVSENPLAVVISDATRDYW